MIHSEPPTGWELVTRSHRQIQSSTAH